MITKSGAVVEKLAREYECPIWECKDGSLVPLVIMNERHLRNAHHYVLERRTSYIQHHMLAQSINRLMASDWDEEPYVWDRAARGDAEAFTILVRLADENIQALQAEAERRGMKLEGSIDYGMAGNRGGLGDTKAGALGRIAGYCRKAARALRLPYLGISR